MKDYEIWHYSAWSKAVYKPYVECWLKVKQEASGYSAWADTDEKKARYVQQYKEHEGIELDPAKIEYNAVLRNMAKFFLNSSWGFFGRNREKKNKELIKRPDRFFRFLCDTTTKNKGAHWLNKRCLMATSEPMKSFVRPDPKGSLVHAIYTTSHARTLLTAALAELDERALYCDTDSIIFKKFKCGLVGLMACFAHFFL